MLTKLSLLCIISSAAVIQLSLGSIKPDVSFNEDNDRFDVSELMNIKMFRESPDVEDGDSDDMEDGRRSYRGDKYGPLIDIIARKDSRDKFQSRKADGGLADDDRMAGREAEQLDDFEENLKRFRDLQISRRNLDFVDNVRGFRKFRRNSKPDPVDEIMMQHAVPIVLEVDGFLTPKLKK
ncbi:unnamed protein product [Chrysodeixis includens]|uniref:Uncharacterized protein n=1 Tax=Chrysodeixis includens TaxID=689277 RepID=A0A9N8KY63_CHRIL|nr:unnamed protein product [Chrysodeixis includens]